MVTLGDSADRIGSVVVVFVTFPRVSQGWAGRGETAATSIAGFGLGAAAMEAEVTDSITDELVFAMMGGRRGSPFGLEKLDPWGHAKEAMDLWAEHLAENVAPRAPD